MSVTNNTKKTIVLDKNGIIVDILDADANTSRYRSKAAYDVFTMDQELFDKLNNNITVTGTDPRATQRIPTQRRASAGGTAEDGWYYRPIIGCGDYAAGERVEIDKVRAHTRSETPATAAFIQPESPTPIYQTPFRGNWQGLTAGCHERSISFQYGSIILPTRGGAVTGDNFLLSAWLYFPTFSGLDSVIVGKLDTDGFTGPESGASGPLGGVTGGSGDSFALKSEGDVVKFHWSDAADTGTQGLNNAITVTTLTTASTGPTSGILIPRQKWHHIAVAYATSGAGATVTSFVNGIRTQNQSTDGGGIKLNSAPFSLGAVFNPGQSDDRTKRWSGYMDELVIGVTSGSELISGCLGTVLQARGQTGSADGSTANLGDDKWQPGVAYYMDADGPRFCNLFDVSSGNSPGLLKRDFYEGIVTNWDPQRHRLLLKNVTGTGDYNYPQISGGFIKGMSCAAHYAVQSTGGNSGANGVGGLDLVTPATYQSIVRNELQSDTDDLEYLRLTGQTNMPGPVGSSTNAFCTLFLGEGGCAGFSGTTGYVGAVGTTHTGVTGGGEFSFVANPENMSVLGQVVTSINAGNSNGTQLAYTIQNAEGQGVLFRGSEVLALWNDLTEFRRLNVEETESAKSKTSSIVGISNGKEIIDAKVIKLGNTTSVTVSKGSFVNVVSAETFSQTGYGFSTKP